MQKVDIKQNALSQSRLSEERSIVFLVRRVMAFLDWERTLHWRSQGFAP
jgi:hypothetical protein